MVKKIAANGLSPRVRGNPRPVSQCRHADGSIPACAGEPPAPQPPAGAAGVYPRVCGGTTKAAPDPDRRQGLSPRVRGNRGLPAQRRGHPGSIPACAGEPNAGRSAMQQIQVYPRVCGGTVLPVHHHIPIPGLSPRVRGNPGWTASSEGSVRSIPACAGEPGSAPSRCGCPWVYPRVCGGTVRGRVDTMILLGLSPRVRGNPKGSPSEQG